jgi:hypothetical protein
MDGMPKGKHALDEDALDTRPVPRRDHIWVLAVIAACALAEVWPSWVGLGAESGFPKLGRMPTDWVLAVVMEAYWAYTLYAWLAASPGPRSRTFAMWSCGVVFILSLVGQVTYHEMTLPQGTGDGERASAAFVTILPVTVLAMIAILIHMRHADREAKAAAARAAARAERLAEIERAEADERASLRRQVDELSAQMDAAAIAHRAESDEALSDLESAQRDLSQALRRTEALERKLAAIDAPKPRKAPGAGAGKNAKTAVDGDDLSMELSAYMALVENSDLRKPRMGGKLAVKIGCSPASARRYRDKFLDEDGSLRELPRESLTGPPGESLTDGAP